MDNLNSTCSNIKTYWCANERVGAGMIPGACPGNQLGGQGGTCEDRKCRKNCAHIGDHHDKCNKSFQPSDHKESGCSYYKGNDFTYNKCEYIFQRVGGGYCQASPNRTCIPKWLGPAPPPSA